MIRFHAVLVDETNCEFTVVIDAPSRSEARDSLDNEYPESRVKVLQTSEEQEQEQMDREKRIYSEDYYLYD